MTNFVTSIHAIAPGVEVIINCTIPCTQGTIHYRPCMRYWKYIKYFYPYYGATLITPLLKLCKTCAINLLNKISITKVSMLRGQCINNSVTHNAYYYAQTLRFALALSLLQSRVRFCRWLIKENRVFWMKPRLWESGHQRESGILTSWSPESGILPELAARAGFGNQVSVPKPTLVGTRFFKRVEPRFRFSIWIRVEPGNRRNRPSLHHRFINFQCSFMSMQIKTN